MKCKVAILLVTGAVLCATNPVRDPCTCTRQLQPVCGSDGETYPNTCLLNCKSSTNSNVTLAKYGPCEENNSGICSCSLEYIPVCGSDGRTYPNSCHVNCKNRENPSLSVVYEGECRLDLPHPNICVCTNDYNPVCGSNGVTYDNECLLNCATAKNSGLRVANDGRCKGDDVKFVKPKFQ